MRSYLVLFVFIFISCTKREAKIETLEALEYRFINMGDSNLTAVNIGCEVFDFKGEPYGGRGQVFSNIGPYDTVAMTISQGSKSYLNKIRKTEVKIAFKKKVYSPLHASLNIIIDGDPYEIGWHYNRWYVPLDDTIDHVSKKIYYIRWPQDSTKLREQLF